MHSHTSGFIYVKDENRDEMLFYKFDNEAYRSSRDMLTHQSCAILFEPLFADTTQLELYRQVIEYKSKSIMILVLNKCCSKL